MAEGGPAPTARSLRARRAIVEATCALVLEVGYGGLTIEAVAARAGVGKPTVYRRWPTKGALVCAALLEGLDIRPFVPPATSDLRADLMTWAHQLVSMFIEPAARRVIEAAAGFAIDDVGAAEQWEEAVTRPSWWALHDRLAAADCSDAAAATDALLGGLFLESRRGASTDVAVESHRAGRLVDLVLRAVQPAQVGTEP